MATEGKDTTEWTAAKWVLTICGIVGTALSSVVVALTASGALDPSSPVVIVLGGIAAVAIGIGGQAGVAYIKGRSAVKSHNGPP